MGLDKQIVEDKIEIVGTFKAVQVRTATIISEDGKEISRSFHRHVMHPDEDISNQSVEVQAICNAVWTQSVKDAWDADLLRQQGVA